MKRPKAGQLPCVVCSAPIPVQRLDAQGDAPELMLAPGAWVGFNRTDEQRTEIVLCCSERCGRQLTGAG